MPPTLGDAVAEPLEFLYMEGVQAVMFLGPEENRGVLHPAPNHDGLALRRVKERRDTLPGIGGGYVAHDMTALAHER